MPLPLPRDVEIELYHMVGAIIIRWGTIDALLATTCSILFEKLGGHSSHPEPPRGLTKRLGFIKKCFNNKPELAHQAKFVSDLCVAITEIGRHRDYFVHGILTNYLPDTQVYEFTKMDGNRDKTGYEQWTSPISKRDLLNIAKVAEQVGLRIQEIGVSLRHLSTAE